MDEGQEKGYKALPWCSEYISHPRLKVIPLRSTSSLPDNQSISRLYLVYSCRDCLEPTLTTLDLTLPLHCPLRLFYLLLSSSNPYLAPSQSASIRLANPRWPSGYLGLVDWCPWHSQLPAHSDLMEITLHDCTWISSILLSLKGKKPAHRWDESQANEKRREGIWGHGFLGRKPLQRLCRSQAGKKRDMMWLVLGGKPSGRHWGRQEKRTRSHRINCARGKRNKEKKVHDVIGCGRRATR